MDSNLAEQSVRSALIELRLIGPLQAYTSQNRTVLPSLRKATAILVILALTEGQSVSRRQLAGLLWSRNDAGQGLARLRDTLHSLRQGLREAMGDVELIRVVGDRVTLRPGAVQVDLLQSDASPFAADFNTNDIAADLDRLDPALDDWLAAMRSRFRERSTPSTPARTGEEPASPPATPKRGSVIGVCLLNPIGKQADDHLALALAEEIATALARVRGLIVISSASVANVVGLQRDLREELGLDFLLQGSLQQDGERLRVRVKLVDAANGAVCWTSDFEYGYDDLFAIQQDVAASVAAGLEPEIPFIAAERMKRGGRGGEDAYGLILRAVSRIHLLERKSFMEAGELLSRAIDLEPEYSPAYSWLALWNVFLVGQSWARDPQASIAKAGEAAEHAVMLDPNDARGLAIAGHVRAFLHRRLDEALPLHERALAVNPSLPLAWHLSGVAHAYRGNVEEARRRFEQCRRLAPRDPHSFFVEGACVIVELLSRNHDVAALIGRRVTQLHPRFSAAYKPYLAALGHLGEKKEAAVVHRRLLQLEPDFSIRSFRAMSPFALREHCDHYVAGLMLAGVT
ncbi:MAG: SARP family transcriptional regulator [Acetobacteraceae bacterium]